MVLVRQREYLLQKIQSHELSLIFLTKIVFDIYDARKCSQLEHVFVSEMYDPKYTQN